MFLCEPCHDKADCQYGFMELPSRGKCEGCGKSDLCLDCHGY